MPTYKSGKAFMTLMCVVGVAGPVGNAFAQYGGGIGLTPINTTRNFHLGFDRPESWGLKYYASTTLPSGLEPPDWSTETERVGAVTVGFEAGWLPHLDAGQQHIGFDGRAPLDLDKAPIFARPSVRVRLPWKLTLVAAGPPPFEVFGVTPHLLAMGVERPLVERSQWRLGWRTYGQIGTVKGAFTCPQSVLGFAPGTPGNPVRCTGESADVATLRYAGGEMQLAYRPRRWPKMAPHVATGGNWIDGAFRVYAPLVAGLDETREWTRGGTFSATGGVSYLFTNRMAFTVDAFYSPLWVRRSPTSAMTNDGC